MTPLSAKRRSELRAEAHKLNPVVLIGDKGLTDEVIAEIDRSLKAHELIKVRATSSERDARDAWLEAICERLQAHPVQQIGKIFVIYRENPEEPARPAEPRAPKTGEKRRLRGGLTERARTAQQARDAQKRKLRDIEDMKRKGKIGRGPRAAAPTLESDLRGEDDGVQSPATGSARPRSRTPSPRPESGPRRRRPRTSR